MPREIWSEGRTVGLSQYEVYVKQHLMEDPDSPLATEREWLASSLAMGSSLILKLGTVGTAGTHSFVDIMLPFNCTLAAANTIMASFFNGTAEYPTGNGSKWATRVVSYGTGNIVSNTSTLHPSGTADPVTSSNVPSGTAGDISANDLNQLRDYMRIVDGVIIQPGTWTEATNKPPEMDFTPNLDSEVADSRPVLRLHIVGQITSGVQILLTGFTIRSVLVGTSTTEGSTSTPHPQNGDFLGPEVFPWASKVVFSVPNSYINYFITSEYGRTINTPTGDTSEGSSLESRKITESPVIDMRGSNPGTFYNSYGTYAAYYDSDTTNPRIPFTTYAVNITSGDAVLTTYQRKSIYPPALYGTLVDSTGQTYLNPLDVVAPGTIKVFYEQDKSVLIDYESTFPGTTAINKKSDGSIETLDANNDLVRITTNYAGIQYLSNDDGHFKGPGGLDLTGIERPSIIYTDSALNEQVYTFAINSNDSTHIFQTIDEIPTGEILINHTNALDNITWSGLISAFRQNKGLDLLGYRLKVAKYTLQKSTDGNSSASDNDDNNRFDITKGNAYIPYGSSSDVKRIYFLANAADETDFRDRGQGQYTDGYNLGNYGVAPDPTNIPVGSLGVGWGWHSMYQVSNSHNVKHWSPLYGAEYDSGPIPPATQSSGSQHRSIIRRDFKYGIICIGRGRAVLPDPVSGDANTYGWATVPNTKTSLVDPDNNNMLVVFVDQTGGIHYISECADTNVSLKFRYYTNSQLIRECRYVEMENLSVTDLDDPEVVGYNMFFEMVGVLSWR